MTMTTIIGCVGLSSVCDTPAGVRKGALIIACTATKMFVLRKRVSTYAARDALVDKYRAAGKIQRSQWLEVDMAHYVVTHHFQTKDGERIPGTGPAPNELRQQDFAALELSDDIRLGCAPMKGGYALMPVPVEPERLDDDIECSEVAE